MNQIQMAIDIFAETNRQLEEQYQLNDRILDAAQAYIARHGKAAKVCVSPDVWEKLSAHVRSKTDYIEVDATLSPDTIVVS